MVNSVISFMHLPQGPSLNAVKLATPSQTLDRTSFFKTFCHFMAFTLSPDISAVAGVSQTSAQRSQESSNQTDG